MDVALVILDGWGLGPTDDPEHRNAVAAADTPNFDGYADAGADGELVVSGRRVGLPDAQMGNSEVGHLNIGAGRVVYQEYTRINDSIAAADLETLGDLEASGAGDIPDPPFDENPAIQAAFDHADEHGGRVHFMGLVSDGGVHSDYEHLFALIEMAADRGRRTTSDGQPEGSRSGDGVEAVTHAFTDGRDTDPRAGAGYLGDLQDVVERYGTGDVATVSGRYYAMDRDQNWSRTLRAYDAIVNREAGYEADSAVAAVEASYARDTTDEFVEPTLVAGGRPLEDGDGVVFFNFRADRARQLARMLADIRPGDWEAEDIATDPPDVTVTTMTQYDRTFDLPVAFEPNQPEDVLGEVLADAGRTQLRIAESEKYAHVTYFLNGGREVEFDGELRYIVESPDVPTYDQQPEMSAPEVTDTAVDVIENEDPDAMILNYANPDMVGHTGDYEAAVAAVEAVDEQLARLVAACRTAGGHVLITADHGNADDMGTAENPHTAHTYNDVPFVYLGPDGGDGGRTVRDGGSLCDVAPTMLTLMGIEQPSAMTGESLLTGSPRR